ncbi:MAG: hypothetical protein K9G24_08420, partial [Candidatus Nanopelagicales bacterium]|nr:hypothetical protein [Candidatus Nanopelagicales bacterium]
MAVRDDFTAGEVLAAADLNDTFASKADSADVDGAATGLFYKTDFASVAFTKTGAGTLDIKAGTKVWVNDTVVTYGTAT